MCTADCMSVCLSLKTVRLVCFVQQVGDGLGNRKERLLGQRVVSLPSKQFELSLEMQCNQTLVWSSKGPL